MVICFFINYFSILIGYIIGGEGDMGMIKDVVIWDKKYYRGGVSVVWKSDNIFKIYRVGGEGCVDVIYIRVKGIVFGRVYYLDYFFVVGKILN